MSEIEQGGLSLDGRGEELGEGDVEQCGTSARLTLAQKRLSNERHRWTHPDETTKTPPSSREPTTMSLTTATPVETPSLHKYLSVF